MKIFLKENKLIERLTAILVVLLSSFFLVSCLKKVELVDIQISEPAKLEYLINEEFDSTGLVVYAFYSDDSKKEISDYEVRGFESSSEGDKVIIVSYEGFSENFTIRVTSKRIVKETTLKVYDVPEGVINESTILKAKVENKKLFVYESRVNNARVFGWNPPNSVTQSVIFDFEGRVHLEVEILNVESLSKVVIRPLSYNITPVITANKISFDLSYPGNYVVEYNESSLNENTKQKTLSALQVFANPLEENPITKEMAQNDPSIIFIEPGIYKTDSIPIQSNQTVYLSGGSVLYGQIKGYNLENVKIIGRGIIAGDIYPRTSASESTIPLEFQHCENITIEGIVFLDPAGWTIHIQYVNNLLIDNVKIITGRPNGDGISIQSSTNVIVENSYVRTWDDSLVVKNVRNVVTENILFRNCTLWTDLAQSMEVGYELHAEYAKNIVFENITVLHNYHKAVMSVHNADDALVSDVHFENITIEDAEDIGDNWSESNDNFLIDINIQYNADWSTSGNIRGKINGVTFDNIVVLDGRDDLRVRINGSDSSHRAENIKINNLKYLGKGISSVDNFVYSNQFTNDISVSYINATGARLNVPYILELSGDDLTILQTIAKNQDGVIIPEFARHEISKPYAGVRVEGDRNAIPTYGTSTTDYGYGGNLNEVTFFPGTNVLLDDNSLWISDLLAPINTSYAALTITFDDPEEIGTIRLYGDQESIYFQLQTISIYGDKADPENKVVYNRLMSVSDYEFSPSKGNFVDIKITSSLFDSIQIRFFYRNDTVHSKFAFLSFIEFFPPSLTFSKSVYASEHEDVYDASYVTDGFANTYFESKKGIFPADITIDLLEIYPVKYIVLQLPPLSSWPARYQTIQILYQTSGYDINLSYLELVSAKSYLFDSATGNLVTIVLESPVLLRTIRFVFTSNSSPSGEAAQISEISVYQ